MHCKICGNNANSEYCWRHKPRAPLKRSRIKKISNKQKTKKEEKKQLLNLDLEFYQKIWHKRLHICCNCGVWLPSFSIIYFDHILEKSKYPKLRHVEENIHLLCWNCHTNKTNGHYSEYIKNKIENTKNLLL